MTTLYHIRDNNTTEKLTTSTTNSSNSVSPVVDNSVNLVDSTNNDDAVGYETMNELYEYYCDCFDRQHVPPTVRRQMIEYIENGIKPELIMIALDVTCDAPMPTWRYTCAILERCKRQGICDKKAYLEGQKRFYGAKIGKKRDNSSDFAQRKVDKGEFEKGFFVDPFARRKA